MINGSARHARSALLLAALSPMLLIVGCAEPEPEGPAPVHPSQAHGIEPPPGVELTESECLVGGWRVEGEPLHDYLLAFDPGTGIDVGGYLTLGFTVDLYYVEPRVGITWVNRGEETLASFVGESEGSYRLVDGQFEATEERDDPAQQRRRALPPPGHRQPSRGSLRCVLGGRPEPHDQDRGFRRAAGLHETALNGEAQNSRRIRHLRVADFTG